MNFDVDLAKFTDRQLDAIAGLDDPRFKFLLYGGALGGGKSYLLRWAAVRTLMFLFSKYNIRNLVGMIASENYPTLKDRQIQKISTEFPKWLGKYHADHKVYGRCYILKPKYGNGVIALRNLDDPSKYQSAEFCFIYVDELTKNPLEVFTDLRSRLRSPGIPDFECKFLGGTNPGGIGHGWCKAYWLDKIYPDELKDWADRFYYIPSKADDNPHLDEAYWNMLNTLPLNLRKAFRDGSWDVYIGQAFPELQKETHMVPDQDPPKGSPLYCTFDWGYGKPFSVGWWYVDSDDRVHRFSEWYGFTGQPDQGLRLKDSEIAEGIKVREKTLGIWDRRTEIIRLGGPDMFNKKPDYKGGGQGPSTAEVFGEHELYFNPGDASRSLKIRQFRERLKTRDSGQKPMMVIQERCAQFWRTVPNITMDTNNIEDVDTKTEDHQYDEACHICMARPLFPAQQENNKKSEVEERLDKLEAKNEGGRYANPGPSKYDTFRRGDLGMRPTVDEHLAHTC